MIQTDFTLLKEKRGVLGRDATFIEGEEIEPALHTIEKDCCKDGVSMEGATKFGKFLEKCSVPGYTGGMGTAKNVLMVLDGVFAKGAPCRIAGVVSMYQGTGG